jgi:hypothetical protein
VADDPHRQVEAAPLAPGQRADALAELRPQSDELDDVTDRPPTRVGRAVDVDGLGDSELVLDVRLR